MVFACSERAVFYERSLRNSVDHLRKLYTCGVTNQPFPFFLFFFFFFLFVTSERISLLKSERGEKFLSPRARRVFSIFPFLVSNVSTCDKKGKKKKKVLPPRRRTLQNSVQLEFVSKSNKFRFIVRVKDVEGIVHL